jgi:hypothetical protein
MKIPYDDHSCLYPNLPYNGMNCYVIDVNTKVISIIKFKEKKETRVYEHV